MNLKDCILFDKEAVKKYYNNIWDKNLKTGVLFSALEELGTPLNIYLGVDLGEGKNWYYVPHALHDGFSAYKSLHYELGLKGKFSSLSPSSSKISFKNFLQLAKKSPKSDFSIKGQTPFKAGQDFNYSVVKGINKPTYWFIEKLNEYLAQMKVGDYSKWMIPVRTDDRSGLNASYISLVVHKNDDGSIIKRKMKQKLLQNEHLVMKWLAEKMVHIGKKTVLAQTKAMLSKTTAGWTGSVSNLKDLGECDQVKEFLMLAPVRWHRPIGLALYKYNGEDYCTICVHKSLDKVFDLNEFTSLVSKN